MTKSGQGILAWAIVWAVVLTAAWMNLAPARDCGPLLLELDLVQVIRLEQWAGLRGCFTGPNPVVPACCDRFDYDQNDAIDMRDAAEWFRRSAVGPWEREPVVPE